MKPDGLLTQTQEESFQFLLRLQYFYSNVSQTKEYFFENSELWC